MHPLSSMSKVSVLVVVLSTMTTKNAAMLALTESTSVVSTTSAESLLKKRHTSTTTSSKTLSESTSSIGVFPAISCQFGGSSNLNTADDDDDALIVPTICISTSNMHFGDMVQTCSVGFRCVTALYTVDADRVDSVGLGCMPPWIDDTQLTDHLRKLRLGSTLDYVTNCSTSNCNPCKAAIDQTTWFWETIAGHEAIGVMIIVTGFIVIWIGACMRASRCGCFWKIPWLLSHPQRGRRGRWWLHPNDTEHDEHSENGPVIVPPKYDEATHEAAPPYSSIPAALPPDYSSSVNADSVMCDDQSPLADGHDVEQRSGEMRGDRTLIYPRDNSSNSNDPGRTYSRATVYE